MKKLMIAAAAAAMVSGAFAVGEAQVYDYTATLKTTACKEGKISRKLADYFNDDTRRLPSQWLDSHSVGDKVGIRKQATVKVAGVIWGCDCPTIALPYWPRRTPGGYLGGYYFWNQQAEAMYNPFRTTFFWNVLNRIDTMTKCEGSYTLICAQAGQRLFLLGGGFGSVSEAGCDTYVKSMSGNLAGFRVAASDEFGCVFCGGNNCVVSTLCDLCWDVAFPGFVNTTGFSAVSGTWKIKYNKSVTKKLSEDPWISRVYTFKRGGNTEDIAIGIDRVWARIYNQKYGADCADIFGEQVSEEVGEYLCETIDKYTEKYEYEDTDAEDIIGEVSEEDTVLLKQLDDWSKAEDEEGEEAEAFNELIAKIADAS